MSEPVTQLDPHDAPPADAPKFELTEDGNQVKYGDKTFVTQEALRQARAEAKALRDEFAKLEPVIPEFQEYLQNKQSRQQASRTAVAPRGDDDYTEEELTGVASLRGYLTADGQHYDLTRARQDLDLMSRYAEKVARKHVEPLRNMTAADRAARNRQDALGRQFVDGQPIAAPKYIEDAFTNLGPELASDPNNANLAQVLAAGLEYLDKRKNGNLTTRREPVFTEASRSRYDTADGVLSRFDQVAARARGKTEEQWAKAVGAKVSGRTGEQPDGSFILEDV